MKPTNRLLPVRIINPIFLRVATCLWELIPCVGIGSGTDSIPYMAPVYLTCNGKPVIWNITMQALQHGLRMSLRLICTYPSVCVGFDDWPLFNDRPSIDAVFSANTAHIMQNQEGLLWWQWLPVSCRWDVCFTIRSFQSQWWIYQWE